MWCGVLVWQKNAYVCEILLPFYVIFVIGGCK